MIVASILRKAILVYMSLKTCILCISSLNYSVTWFKSDDIFHDTEMTMAYKEKELQKKIIELEVCLCFMNSCFKRANIYQLLNFSYKVTEDVYPIWKVLK